MQEARLSSEIENIVTTNDELYRAAANRDGKTDPHTKEVLRYREALYHGFHSLKDRPLNTNLFIELVRLIKQVDIGIRAIPGTALKSDRGEVIYTPPVGEQVIRDKLANLEQFIHAEDELDPLVKMAVMHYQFEAIHPFPDGNGRTGRILNLLYLVEQQLLDIPVLFCRATSSPIGRNIMPAYGHHRSAAMGTLGAVYAQGCGEHGTTNL